MKFLVPIGGFYDAKLGLLTSPNHRGVPIGIKKGMSWAADNGSFSGSFDADSFLSWLTEVMHPYFSTCLFVTVPDVLKDHQATVNNYLKWSPKLSPWPLAFVAQDGILNLPDLQPDYSTLFIGGSTEFKLSQTVIELIKQAQSKNKHIHIGRVNWKKRYNYFRNLPGSDQFTCDGTRFRYQGRDKTIRAWLAYMAQIPLSNSLPNLNHSGQSNSPKIRTLFHRD